MDSTDHLRSIFSLPHIRSKDQYFMLNFQLFSALFYKESLSNTILEEKGRLIAVVSKNPTNLILIFRKKCLYLQPEQTAKFHVVATPVCQFSAVRNRLLVLFIPRSAKSILRPSSEATPRQLRGNSDFSPTKPPFICVVPSVYLRCSSYVAPIYLLRNSYPPLSLFHGFCRVLFVY